MQSLRQSISKCVTDYVIKYTEIKPTQSSCYNLRCLPILALRICCYRHSERRSIHRNQVVSYPVKSFKQTQGVCTLALARRLSQKCWPAVTVAVLTASGLYCSLRLIETCYAEEDEQPVKPAESVPTENTAAPKAETPAVPISTAPDAPKSTTPAEPNVTPPAEPKPAAPPVPKAAPPIASPAAAARNFIADIVGKAIPAVVFIEIKGKHPKSGKRVTLANGSGFIVRSNGLIITNAHVVANKPTVSVKLHDGSTYEGTVMTVDPVCDLATVKIECDNPLPVIPLGKSSTIRPGEFVAAMGSPLSLHKTVTVGIVSSHLRGSKELGMNNKNMEYIQTDATIGLGNSGGPLVNLEGEAIGINTLKLTEGISFAIPTDYAKELVEKADAMANKNDNNKPNYIANGKETTKPRYVGITMLTLTEPIINELKDKNTDFPDINKGVYIHKVVVSSPAYAGGLHAGDVIVDINGTAIETSADVYDVVEKCEVLSVTVIRGKHQEKFSVVTETL